MALYNVYAGMGGGFGGATFIGTYECDSEEEATDLARKWQQKSINPMKAVTAS